MLRCTPAACVLLLALLVRPLAAQEAPPAPPPVSRLAPAELRLPEAVPAEVVRRGLSDEESAAVAELLARATSEDGAVGVAVALVREGRVVEVQTRGWEDVAAGIPVGAETRFRWASISKPMTAVAALQLVEQERLDLAADVRTLVPEFPEKPWPVTIEQLLCHQGGVVHYANGLVLPTLRTYDVEHPFADPVLALDRFKASPLIAEPGTRYAYTTHGYVLLGAAVQRAGGAAFEAQVRARILEPLGMTTTVPDQPWVAIPHRTQGYRSTRAGFARLDDDEDVHWKLPGGGWTSTVDDLARFGLGLMDGRLLHADTLRSMTTSRVPRDGEDPHYGLGIGVGRVDGRVTWHHSGSQARTATYMLLCPDEGLGACVMCNTRTFKPAPLARALVRVLAS